MTEKNQDKVPKEIRDNASKGNPGIIGNHISAPNTKKKEKDPEEIPILKYGPANNFTKFKEAISKTALKDYGQLGKLIKLGKYYEPKEPVSTD